MIRSYTGALRRYVIPELGAKRLGALTRSDVQDFADRLLARGLDPATVRNELMPLRAICRRAFGRGHIAANPTSGLELPAPRGRRDRIASPAEARALIQSLPIRDRALWATALYAGLRRGELQALRWSDIDLQIGVIHVERSWDRHEGPIEPKTRAGRRTTPITAPLRTLLIAHKLANPNGPHSLAFPTATGHVFDPATVLERARRHWRRAELTPIGLHECRHAFASLMIAAGVNAKAISTYLGHASITITLDRYGHLMPAMNNTPPRCSIATSQRRSVRDGTPSPGRPSSDSPTAVSGVAIADW